ncbi:MAG TPA: type III secretion system chaperone [Geminicoccaceae bacterium]|nr:type III secretion system chaperone [Geminicoccaceae bacterium]
MERRQLRESRAEEGSDRVYLYGRVAALPARHHTIVYGKLLMANLHGHYTDDAWFALDAEAEEIVLNRTLRLGQLDASGFDAVVTGSMDMIELWSRELASPDFDTADGAEDAEAPTGALRPDIMIRG